MTYQIGLATLIISKIFPHMGFGFNSANYFCLFTPEFSYNFLFFATSLEGL